MKPIYIEKYNKPIYNIHGKTYIQIHTYIQIPKQRISQKYYTIVHSTYCKSYGLGNKNRPSGNRILNHKRIDPIENN